MFAHCICSDVIYALQVTVTLGVRHDVNPTGTALRVLTIDI